MDDTGNSGYPDFYDGTGQDLRVDVTDLASFAASVRLEMQNFAANWNGAVAPLMMATADTFGVNAEFREAAWTRQHHSGVLAALDHLVADALKGFHAIAEASQTIAAEYRSGDHEGAEGIDLVAESFDPSDPDANSVDKLWEQQQESGQDGSQGGQQQGTAANPTDTGDAGSPYNQGQSPSGGPVTLGKGDGQVTIAADPYANAPYRDVKR